MRFVAHGHEMEYEVNGPRTGTPVVLIHGFPFSKEMWKPQVEVLKNKYYTVSYDVRGHGRSGTGDGQYTLELFVDDFIALLDHLRIGRAVVAGLSMGGYIALRAIERHPERFRGLILADTRSEADSNEGKISRANQARKVKADGMKKFAETFVAGLFFKETFQRNPHMIDEITSVIAHTSPLAVAGTFIALAARTDTTASLYTMKVPALILVGRHDSLTPPSASSAMKEKIPNAEMFILPKAAHMSNLENAEEFNRRLLEFLSGIP